MRLQLQFACDDGRALPSRAQFEAWAAAALGAAATTTATARGGEVTVRVVERAEMRALNHRYRGHNRPTNVLSFPFQPVAGVPLDILGDIVICAPLVAAEAAAQHKPPMEHWALLLIHGILHLCGYDHQQDEDAARMEAAERRVLAELGMGG